MNHLAQFLYSFRVQNLQMGLLISCELPLLLLYLGLVQLFIPHHSQFLLFKFPGLIYLPLFLILHIIPSQFPHQHLHQH
jgi:hypothetical protein